MSQAKSPQHAALVRYRAAEQALRLIYEQIQEAERATERSRKLPKRRDPEEGSRAREALRSRTLITRTDSEKAV